MKKTIFLLNVDNYAPEITKLTYPTINFYANKINANVHIINERKFPNYPPVYEKLQIYKLAKKMKNDWNIYIDSDTLIHPDMFDITEHITKDIVCHHGADFANNRWRYDNYFRRDGRNIGSCNWFTIASDWCVDLWKPLDITYESALDNIFPIQVEKNTIISREHLIDDYVLSRNIAKYGFKFTTVIKLIENLGCQGDYFWHQYTINSEEKVLGMINTLSSWGVSDYVDPKIDGFLSLGEMLWLYYTAKDMNSIVEIGSWKGKSAHALLSSCKGEVYLVDNFNGSIDEIDSYHQNLKKNDIESELKKNISNFNNAHILKMNSVDASKKFEDKSVDMVFIDGSHDYQSVYNDINAWLPKCRKMICGHDYDRNTVSDAVRDCGFFKLRIFGSIWSVILPQ